MTIRQAVLGLAVVLVIASLVVDALVFGAAGHALNPDLFRIVEPLSNEIDLYVR